MGLACEAKMGLACETKMGLACETKMMCFVIYLIVRLLKLTCWQLSIAIIMVLQVKLKVGCVGFS